MSVGTIPGQALEARFHAMGTEAHVILAGGTNALLDEACLRIADLELRWSRFIAGNELARINAAAGHPVVVAPVTFEVISRAVESWRATQGLYDPTVLPSVIAAGYDRSFDELHVATAARTIAAEPAPGCAGIELDPIVRSVTLPRGVAVDLGGIGKGFAADLVSAELLDSGASGACVNLGGDLRVRGVPAYGEAWVIEIEAEPGFEPSASGCVTLADGGVATTSSCRRTWSVGEETVHHVIDPRTGYPRHDPCAAATVIATDAWQAETLAKAVFMLDDDDDAEKLLESVRATGRIVCRDGSVHELRGFEEFRA